MHGCKPHEKIVITHEFSVVRIPTGNLLEISAAGTGLISTYTFIFCEVPASLPGGSKYIRLLILNLAEMVSNMLCIKLERALRRKAYLSSHTCIEWGAAQRQ